MEATPLAGTRLEAKIREASACSNGNGHSPNVSIVLDRSAKAPAEKLEVLIENDDRFRSTWRRTRKQPGWTPSEWDMSIASRLANAGWSDQEICDGMVEHRRSHGGKDHPSAYYERTIANARDGREASERGAPPKYDRDTGEQLSPLDELNRQTDDVEFLEAKQIGRQKARWYFTVRNRETGEPEPLDPLTTAQIFDASLSKLANRIREARGGRLPTPRKNSSEWVALTDALIAASPREDHGATDGGAWRRRLAAYLEKTWSVEPHRLDPNDPDGKRDAIFEACPFEDPDGRLWVHVGTWLEFLETRRMDADEAAVRSALKHLGFEPQQLTAKVEGENRSRRYWRSPVGFDWRFEE